MQKIFFYITLFMCFCLLANAQVDPETFPSTAPSETDNFYSQTGAVPKKSTAKQIADLSNDEDWLSPIGNQVTSISDPAHRIGDVAIGLTTPTEKLDVLGTVKFAATLTSGRTASFDLNENIGGSGFGGYGLNTVNPVTGINIFNAGFAPAGDAISDVWAVSMLDPGFTNPRSLSIRGALKHNDDEVEFGFSGSNATRQISFLANTATGWNLSTSIALNAIGIDGNIGNYEMTLTADTVKSLGKLNMTNNIIKNVPDITGGENPNISSNFIHLKDSINISGKGDVCVLIDKDDDETDRQFVIAKNGEDASSYSELFKIDEDGNVTVGDPTASSGNNTTTILSSSNAIPFAPFTPVGTSVLTNANPTSTIISTAGTTVTSSYYAVVSSFGDNVSGGSVIGGSGSFFNTFLNGSSGTILGSSSSVFDGSTQFVGLDVRSGTNVTNSPNVTLVKAANVTISNSDNVLVVGSTNDNLTNVDNAAAICTQNSNFSGDGGTFIGSLTTTSSGTNTGSAVIGGQGGTLSGQLNSVLLGGIGLTASQNNTAYAPQLVLDAASQYIPSSTADPAGEIGQVSIDVTGGKIYVKTNSGWLEFSGSSF